MKNAPRVKFLVMAAASSSVRFRARLLGRNCGGAVVVAAAVGVGVVLVAGGGGGGGARPVAEAAGLRAGTAGGAWPACSLAGIAGAGRLGSDGGWRAGGGGAAALLGLRTSLEEEELQHSDGLIGFAQMGLSSSRDVRREFDRLIRGGIPLIYRSKIWLECSGGLEMMEPGLFQELLNQSDPSEGVPAEIEKDVKRTMPLNVFFGGDGAGVEKLRRVLLAYSRYVFVVRNLSFLTHKSVTHQAQSGCWILPGDEPHRINAPTCSCR